MYTGIRCRPFPVLLLFLLSLLGWGGASAALAVPSVSVGNTTVLAGPSGTQHAVFTVSLSAASTTAVTVAFATANGTAVAGTDYAATSGTLTIPAASTSNTISVPVTGGETDASGLTFGVTLSSPVNATLGASTGAATIIHDAPPVAQSVTPNPLSSAAGTPEVLSTTYSSVGGASNITTASLSIGKLTSAATSLYADYSVSTNLFYVNSNGTAIGGYAPGSANLITTPLGTLNLAGTTVTKSGNQLMIGWDFSPSASLIGSEGVYLDATDSFGLTSGWQNLGAWTVIAPGIASLNTITVLSAASTTQHAMFTVSLSGAVTSAATLSYATANGTAIAGVNYTATSGTLTIPAGSTTAAISVPIPGQTAASALVFTVTLSSPVNATLGTATGTATIVPDTGPVNQSVAPNPAASAVSTPELLATTFYSAGGVTDIATANLSIGKLSSPATSLYAEYVASTNLCYLNSNGTAAGGYAPGSSNVITTPLGALNLANTTVTKIGNLVTIGWDVTPTASLLGAEGVYLDATDSLGMTSGWQKLGTWTVFAPVSGSINNTSVVTVPGGSGHAVFTVTLSGPSPVPVSFSYATADGTATTLAQNYTATSGTLTIPAGSTAGTISVPVNNPNQAETLDFTLNLSAPVNATLSAATGTGNIISDLPPACVSVSPSAEVSGVNTPQLLTTEYTWTSDASSIGTANLCVGTLSAPSTSLYAEYVGATNLFYLNANGVAVGGYAAGSANVISTPLGTLNLATTTVVKNGNELDIAWDMTPNSTLIGTQGVYLDINDSLGLSSSWQKVGIWNIASIPANDNFASAQAISGSTGSVNGTTAGSSVQTGEPSPYGGNQSVWYQYTAPSGSPGRCQISVTSGPTLSVAAFSGSSLTALTQLNLGTDAANFATVSGAIYTIQVTSENDTLPFALAWSWVSGPPNDAFANAQSISGSTGSVNGTTVGASLQPGEPNPHSINPLVDSVWYQYVAPSTSTGAAIFSLVNNNVVYDYVSTYTGTSLTNLTLLDSQQNSLLLTTQPGVTYDIQIGTASSARSSFTLGWNWAPTPANDNFANAQVVTGASGSVPGTTLGASYESFEAEQGVQQSVWYSFTAPAGSPAKLTFSLTGYGSTQYVTAFTGPSTKLVQIAAASNTISFVPTAGQTYSVQIANFNLTPSAFTFNWFWTDAPPNDNMANPQGISGISGSVNGTTVYSTLENGEPNPNNVTNSVWYVYDAPFWSAGNVTFTLGNNTQNQVMEAFYSPNTLSNTPLAGGSSVTFATIAGGSYLIQVGALNSNTGTFSLGWSWTGPPQNDNFANAQSITGESGQVGGTTVLATRETGDPAPSTSPATVWYQFTDSWTSETANFTLSNQTQGDTIVVYTGSSLGTLVSTGNANGAGVATTYGTTYYVEVVGGTGTGTFILNWTTVPANDAFASAVPISGPQSEINGTTVGSTFQSGEPNPGSSFGSVWYVYTAPVSGPGELVLGTSANPAPYLAIYQGTSLSNLTRIAFGNSNVTCETSPGGIYYVQVSPLLQTVDFTLSWSWSNSPANDNFANAQAISGSTGTVTGTTISSSLETGEPPPPGGATNSVWYLYTAPSGNNGTLTFDTSYPTFDITVFRGSSLTNLSQLAQGAGNASAVMTAGVSYYLQVSSIDNTSTFSLGWVWAATPANDNLANAQAISGASGSVTGTTTGATFETGETAPYSGNESVWYLYTAPASSGGNLTFSLSSTYQQTAVVYQGTSYANLVTVNQGQAILATPGGLYYVQVSCGYPNQGPLTLSWNWVSAPSNDNFANAQAISGASGSVPGTTVAATSETGEPNASGAPQTVWYAYTAPTTSTGYVALAQSNYTNQLTGHAYTGTSLSNLVPANGYGFGFATVPGTTYYVQLGSELNYETAFNLSWTWAASPPNDYFANAQPITGLSGSVTGTTVGAGLETGEPATDSGYQSVWYVYTAPAGTSVVTEILSFAGSAEPTAEVFTGSSLAGLTSVASDENVTSFEAAPGATYYIRITTFVTGGAFTLDWSSQPTPPNDNIANATPISGPSGSVSGTTVGSTQELNESTSYDHTVWYLYSAPNGYGYFGLTMTVLSGGQPGVTIYSGTPGNLTLLSTVNGLMMSPGTNTNYYFQVGCNDGATGTFTLAWSWVPQNDSFEGPASISSTSGSMIGTTIGASIETGEPDTYTGNKSVWYKYTAPSTSSGSVTVALTNGATSQLVQVFTGTALANLVLVTSSSNGATFTVTPGSIYYIQVRTSTYAPCSFNFNWSWIGATTSAEVPGKSLGSSGLTNAEIPPGRKPSGQSA